MNGNLVRDVATATGAAGLLAGLFFVPYRDGVAAVGSLLGHSGNTIDGVRGTAMALLALALVLVLITAVLGVLLAYRRIDVPNAATGPGVNGPAATGAACTMDDVVMELSKQPQTLREILLVGYSLGFAERIRSHLDTYPRALDVRLGLPTDAWVSTNVDERIPIAHRVDGIQKRVRDWQDLEARSRVRSVRIVVQDVAPHWFAIAFADVIFFGSYPLIHDSTTGRHVLIKNDERPLYRVDGASPPGLFTAVQRQVECRVS